MLLSDVPVHFRCGQKHAVQSTVVNNNDEEASSDENIDRLLHDVYIARYIAYKSAPPHASCLPFREDELRCLL